jgi:hypothetical protein
MSRSTSARTLVLAALVVVGCSSKSQPAASGSGSAGSGSGSADPCPADAGVHIKGAMDATEAYFTKLAAAMKPWTDATSCDVIKTALEGLAADGDAYAQFIDGSKAWSTALSEACRDSIDSRWAGDRAKLMEKNFRAVVDGGIGQVKRCLDAPGVKDAAMHAIRLMKKRK